MYIYILCVYIYIYVCVYQLVKKMVIRLQDVVSTPKNER